MNTERFTWKDYLEHLESVYPDCPYDLALAMHDEIIRLGFWEPIEMSPQGEWVYRYVPKEERPKSAKQTVVVWMEEYG